VFGRWVRLPPSPQFFNNQSIMITSEDYERVAKLMKDYANSDEHKAFLIKQKAKKNIKLIRFRRFEKYLETHDFDRLIYRLIL